jgi:transposase-like protein
METPVELSHPAFHDENAARAYLESVRWPNGPVCGCCGLSDNVKVLGGGKSMGDGWYHCTQCREKFTVRKGSIFERSHVALHKWLLAFRLMASAKKGVSAHQLHRSLGVTYKTAWFMAMRIREAMTDTAPAPLGGGNEDGNQGVVEADETYFGSKNEIVKRTKKGKASLSSKRAVVALVERGGKVRSFHVERADKATILAIIAENVAPAAKLNTDESALYWDAGRLVSDHSVVKHSDGVYVRGTSHTNTIEGYFSIFKRGMKGVYQHCGEHHLHRYLAEFDFRYSNRVGTGCDDVERTFRALKGAEGKRLTYQISHGKAA